MFVDEARLAARIRHPNVVSTLDVVEHGNELLLVMDYVHGEALSKLARIMRAAGTSVPARIAASIMIDALHGLHAAHEAKGEQGQPLGLVHRDVSPQNILIGADGIARIVDFGVAKASGRAVSTRGGAIKGKLTYMAPEQIRGEPVSRVTDVYAASIVLWETLTGKRLFTGDNEGEIVLNCLTLQVPPPSSIVPDLPPAYDAIVARGLSRNPSDRYASARDDGVVGGGQIG
ncbi:serine/threonine protein kinase, partial [bacterium]